MEAPPASSLSSNLAVLRARIGSLFRNYQMTVLCRDSADHASQVDESQNCASSANRSYPMPLFCEPLDWRRHQVFAAPRALIATRGQQLAVAVWARGIWVTNFSIS